MERDRKRKLWKITAAVSAGILVILAAVLLIRKYMPTGQKMSGYDYFKTDSAAENDSTLVILDNEILYDKGRYIDGRLYLQQSFVQDNVNMRFIMTKKAMRFCIRTGAQSIRIIRTSRGIGTRTVIRMIRSMK